MHTSNAVELAQRFALRMPCTQCSGHVPAEELVGDVSQGWGLWLADDRFLSVFCQPSCLEEFLQTQAAERVQRRGVGGDCWLCRQETWRQIPVFVPAESRWDDVTLAFFCSVGCVVSAMWRDVDRFESCAVVERERCFAAPNWPLEEPRRVASLKRERRRLRRGELARLGF